MTFNSILINKQQTLTDTGDVSELLLIRNHVTAQRVDDGFHLKFFHFVHQGTKTATVGGGSVKTID